MGNLTTGVGMYQSVLSCTLYDVQVDVALIYFLEIVLDLLSAAKVFRMIF